MAKNSVFDSLSICTAWMIWTLSTIWLSTTCNKKDAMASVFMWINSIPWTIWTLLFSIDTTLASIGFWLELPWLCTLVLFSGMMLSLRARIAIFATVTLYFVTVAAWFWINVVSGSYDWFDLSHKAWVFYVPLCGVLVWTFVACFQWETNCKPAYRISMFRDWIGLSPTNIDLLDNPRSSSYLRLRWTFYLIHLWLMIVMILRWSITVEPDGWWEGMPIGTSAMRSLGSLLMSATTSVACQQYLRWFTLLPDGPCDRNPACMQLLDHPNTDQVVHVVLSERQHAMFINLDGGSELR